MKRPPPQETQWPDGAIFTVGHSTRPIERFIELLETYGIQCLADIRTVPRSRHNPQFNEDALQQALGAHGIEYVALRTLGGLRHARKDSINTGWRNTGFRGYADYMQTAEFEAALDELIRMIREKSTVYCCTEAVFWRPHEESTVIPPRMVFVKKDGRWYLRD